MADDSEVLTDITRALLRIGGAVLGDLARLLPTPDEPAFGDVRQRLAQLTVDLESQPDTVLAASHDDQLESLLTRFGPGDPLEARPFLSPTELRPGDLLVRCAPALSSQLTELMIWSRYTHVGLYVGEGMIIDSTWQYGVRERPLSELLHESNRVGVLRLPGLTAEQVRIVLAAAESQQSAAYNFTGLEALGAQKLDELTTQPPHSLGQLLDLVGRAELLPSDPAGPTKFACSELVAFSFRAIDIALSHAGGFTPGDVMRLSQAGLLLQVGRLRPVGTDQDL